MAVSFKRNIAPELRPGKGELIRLSTILKMALHLIRNSIYLLSTDLPPEKILSGIVK
jgi:hypothetical protein